LPIQRRFDAFQGGPVRIQVVVLATVVATATAGCGGASDRLAEESLENALEESGATDAKVDIADGSMSFTTRDASGKTTVSVSGGEDTQTTINITVTGV
jgi:hypothetical protein